MVPKKTYDVPELIQTALKKKYKVAVYFISEKSWIDVGQWEDLNNALNDVRFN